MRLLEITNDFPPTIGGIENYLYSLVARWKPDDIVVLTRDRPGAAEVDATLACTVHREPVSMLLPNRRLWERVRVLLAEGSFDAVHFASPLPLALLGPRILRATGIPYAVSLHGGELVTGARLAGPLMAHALGDAAVVLPVSSFTKEALLRLVAHPPPAVVVRPGVDAERYAPADPEDVASRADRPPAILSVSRLVARKGPGRLIAALPAVRERHPGTVLVVAGDGPDRRRLERAAGTAGMAGAVQFLGARPWHALPEIYARADIFALPTRERFFGLETEGFPLVYLEAAASGLPVVAGEAGGVREAVQDGETGLVVDGRDTGEVTRALLRLLGDRDWARAMGSNGRRRVREGFSWDAAADRFRNALETHAG